MGFLDTLKLWRFKPGDHLPKLSDAGERPGKAITAESGDKRRQSRWRFFDQRRFTPANGALT